MKGNWKRILLHPPGAYFSSFQQAFSQIFWKCGVPILHHLSGCNKFMLLTHHVSLIISARWLHGRGKSITHAHNYNWSISRTPLGSSTISSIKVVTTWNCSPKNEKEISVSKKFMICLWVHVYISVLNVVHLWKHLKCTPLLAEWLSCKDGVVIIDMNISKKLVLWLSTLILGCTELWIKPYIHSVHVV